VGLLSAGDGRSSSASLRTAAAGPRRVVESLKAVAPMRGFTAYQTLLKSYISEGLRRDEVQFDQHTARKLAEALKRRGVAEKVLQEAMAEIASDS
jgi:hypothetical protein